MMAKPLSAVLSICVLTVPLLMGCNRPHPSVEDSNAQAVSPNQAARSSETQMDVEKPDASPSLNPLLNGKDTRPLIVAFGDSLTAGYGTNIGASYPDFLQRDLDALGYRYRVVNEGRSGNTTKDGVVRVQEIAAAHPSVAIVAFGGNDGLRGIPIHDTQTNLETIISTLQAAHAKVLLGGITLPPNYGSDYIARFNAIYETLARKYHAPLLPFMLKNVYGVPASMQNDGIHATAQGNRQVAKNFLPLLLPLLQKTSPDAVKSRIHPLRGLSPGQP